MTYDQADYLRIPLLDGGFGTAQIFEIAPARPDCVFLGISNQKTDAGTDTAISPLSLPQIMAFAFCADDHIISGHWPKAGFDQIPRFRDVFDYNGAALLDFPDHPTHDPAVIEAFVNGLHGLYPWNGFGDLFDQMKRTDVAAPRRRSSGTPIMTKTDRINAQFAFLTEADRLKTVLRATKTCDGARFENSGEHSWHVALYALTMAEHAAKPVNINRVLKMLLLHDLVEIDAGDTPIHSAAARDTAAQEAVEQAAADRIFGLLPPDQAQDFRALWDEFEAAATDDAIFAKSIDRVQPVIANLETGGQSWVDYNVSREQVEARVGAKVNKGAPALWNELKHRLDAWFNAA